MNNLSQLLPHISFPSEIYFKKGSLIRLKFLNTSKVAILTGKHSLKESGSLEKMQNYLKPCKIKTFSIDSEPTLDTVQKLANQIISFKPELLIACGGGSVLDAAKIARILMDNPKLNLLNYIKPHTLPINPSKLKLIAIPTTTGSGSEISWTALVINAQNKRKIPFVSSALIPDSIILDPELVLNLSSNLTGSTAIDAFTHALESYCSTLNNSFSNQYAIMTGTLIHEFLLETLKKPDFLEGKEHLQFAALFAGLAQNATSTGAIHALSHALGATTNTSHSLGNIIFLPAILQSNCMHSPKPLLFLKEIGFKSLAEFLKWFDQIKFHAELESSWSKISKKIISPPIEQIASLALEDICMKTNIYQFKITELIQILKETR